MLAPDWDSDATDNYVTSLAAELLSEVWGFSSFRDWQEAVVNALHGDRKDVLVLMATGGGKSLMFQLPAIMAFREHGHCAIVVSPLISLIHDQICNLKKLGVPAAELGTASTANAALIYTTPEKLLRSENEIRKMEKRISLIAIDEAHCVSEWGHDFRPEYQNLSMLRQWLPSVPVVALTATATLNVREEIVNSLGLSSPLRIETTFNRPNILYEVRMKDNKLKEQSLRSALSGVKDGATIIYTLSKKEAEDLAELCCQIGYKAEPYHAGLTDKQRKHTQDQFKVDAIQVVCATIAFGMGIDKPDVRLVIHWGLAKTIEGYYQQTGRAGRDGLPSRAILFWGRGDAVMLNKLQESHDSSNRREHTVKLTQAMESYASSSDCRRSSLLHYLGESGTVKAQERCCDVCSQLASAEQEPVVDVTAELPLLLRAIQETGNKFGAVVPVSVLRGSNSAGLKQKIPGHVRLHSFGKGKHLPDHYWKALLYNAHDIGYVSSRVTQSGFKIFSVSLKGLAILQIASDKNPHDRIEIRPNAEFANAHRKVEGQASKCVAKINVKDEQSSNKPVDNLLSELKVIRASIAREEQVYSAVQAPNDSVVAEVAIFVAAFQIFSEQCLIEMSRLCPRSIIQFSQVSGVGAFKCKKYYGRFTEVCNQSKYDSVFYLDKPAAQTVPAAGGGFGAGTLDQYKFVRGEKRKLNSTQTAPTPLNQAAPDSTDVNMISPPPQPKLFDHTAGVYSYDRKLGKYTCTKEYVAEAAPRLQLNETQRARIEKNRQTALMRKSPPVAIQPSSVLTGAQRDRIQQKRNEAAQKQALRERLEKTQKQLEELQSTQAAATSQQSCKGAQANAPVNAAGMLVFGDAARQSPSSIRSTQQAEQQRVCIAEKRKEAMRLRDLKMKKAKIKTEN